MKDLDPRMREALQLDNPSGLNAVLGLRFTEISGTLVTAEFDVKPDLLQAHGIVHGGTYTAVVEALGSYGGAVALDGKGYVVGVHNGTDFLRPTREGTLSGKAVPIFQGRSQQLWQVDITNSAGKLAATGQLRVQNIYFGSPQDRG